MNALRTSVQDVYIDPVSGAGSIRLVRATPSRGRCRDRSLGSREPLARACLPRVGAARGARIRDSGRRRAPLPAGADASDRLHPELRRNGARDRLDGSLGPLQGAVLRARAAPRRRARGSPRSPARRRRSRSSLGGASSGCRSAACTAPAAVSAPTSRARARTSPETTSTGSTGPPRRVSRSRAGARSSSSASTSRRRRLASSSSATDVRRCRSSEVTGRGSTRATRSGRRPR